MKYLLDTNVLIDILRGNRQVIDKLQRESISECCISDITVYELYYGAYRSKNPEESAGKIDRLVMSISVLDTTDCMKDAARQKSMLASEGQLIEDFDIIIGTAAIANGLVLVTGNTKHLERLSGLTMTDWRH